MLAVAGIVGQIRAARELRGGGLGIIRRSAGV